MATNLLSKTFTLFLLAFCCSIHAQSRDGEPKLHIINGSLEVIDLFWLKSDTERVASGSVDPGKSISLRTTLGHRFEMIGRSDKATARVTCEAKVQGFCFDPNAVESVPVFYKQIASANGLPVVASTNVNPYAVKEAVYLVNQMLANRPDVLNAIIKSGARLCILSYNEFTTDLPEFSHLGEETSPGGDGVSAKDYWDSRARGTGGSETDPFCSCAEENLLGYPGDPYSTECILIHEFAHCIHLRGMSNVDPTFDIRLRSAYGSAMKSGLWKGKYASVNHHEYFAEGVQSWFDNNRSDDHDHNHVDTRSELLEYDPALAEICREVFGDTVLKYTKPITRLKDHLAGYDPKSAPTFVWPKRLMNARSEIRKKAQERDRSAQVPSIHMIGDSTMADKPLTPALPERGWGQLLPIYLKHAEMVRNHAKNGRSTKSFIDEGLWSRVHESLKTDDWVIIQFGHNDEKKDSPERFSDAATTYRDNLKKYVVETRQRGAQPILATPIVRRRFDDAGKLVETHGEYPDAVRFVAKELDVPLIDLHERTREMVAGYDSSRSKGLFLWIDKDLYKSLPEGKRDDTHLSADGASRVCELAIDELRRLQHPLAAFAK